LPILEASLQQEVVHGEISKTLRLQKQVDSLSFKQYSSMILKNFKIYSQNVCENKTFMDSILETNKDFNIIFIQESL